MRARIADRIAPVIAAAGAILIVLQWAAARPLWLDEEMIALNLRDRSIGQLTGALSFDQTAPYGWLVVQRLLILGAGTSELTLRALPALFGIATVATALWIGRRWMNAAGAIVLVLLCAIGQWLTFHFFEVKPYSADTCFALLLPALAAWAIEQPHRALIWWPVVAAAQWFSNGALLVTPGCAVVLVAASARRGGLRGLARSAWPGAIWAASFALHYLVSLRHAARSEMLQAYWAFAFPPQEDLLAIAGWIRDQLVPFAIKPGGTRLGWLLWVAVAAGFALATDRRRTLAWAFATVPLSAFALAALRLVPLYERLSLWVVPALYVGVACLADASARSRHRAVRLVGALAVVPLCVDMAYRGVFDLRHNRPRSSNHQLDDRAAVRWLAARARPGDVWLSTHFGLPAVWWYADDGSAARAFELSYVTPDECHREALADALKNDPRRLVYVGFRDVPRGFDELLVDRLSELGAVTGFRRFDDSSIALVIDGAQPFSGPTTLSHLDTTAKNPADTVKRPPGCIAARPARPW